MAAMVRLDMAETGYMPPAVRAVLGECVRLADRAGPHALRDRMAYAVEEEVYRRLGRLLNVPAAETVLFPGAADAFRTLVARLPLGRGERVWTTPYEGTAQLGTLLALRDRTGCRLEIVPLRADGAVDVEWMAAHLDDDVALVSLVHAPPGAGPLGPVEEVGRLLAGARCLYAVDAAHAVGQLPVDAARIGCDLLTADGWRFLGGPYGIGFAHTGPRLTAVLAPYGTAAPSPPADAAVAALNAALARPAPPATALLPLLRAAVEAAGGSEATVPGTAATPAAVARPDALPGTPVGAAVRPPAVLAFGHPAWAAARLAHRLAARGVLVGKTAADHTPLLPGPALLRASLGPETTEDDLARFAAALRETVGDAGPAPALPAPPARTAAAPARRAVKGAGNGNGTRHWRRVGRGAQRPVDGRTRA